MCQVLKGTKDIGEQIDVCRKLAVLYKYSPDEEKYLKKLQAISLNADSLNAFYEASLSLTYYYCNYNVGDSLFAVWDHVKSVVEKRGVQPNVIFDIRNCLCRYYLINEEYEVAMSDVVGLLRDVEGAGYKQGIIVANENLGLIYLLIGRDEEAIESLEKSLFLLRETEDRLRLEVQIMSYLCNAYLRLNEFDKMKSLLNYYTKKLQQVNGVSNPSPVIDEQTAEVSDCMLYSNWLNYYVAMKMEKEAGKAIAEASRYIKEINDPGYSSVYYLALARYYHFIKDYKSAVEAIDTVLPLDYSLEPLEVKIAILMDAGMLEEATAAYKETTNMLDEQNVIIYKRQINQLQVLHHLIEKEKQEQQLKNQQIELKHKQQLLLAFFVFACVLITILIGVIRYALKTRNLKNALEREQYSLKESMENLRFAKEGAERSDRVKTDFVANVSHEIRTPLNAIVGFSTLLNEASEEEQSEFIDIINENTDLLLKLVNDVLDISKLESDNFSLDMQDVNVLHACQEVLESVRHRVADHVKLNFTHPETSLILRSDLSRFRQLLLNLLINAAKYTEEGEINLDCKIDPETGELIVSVTDTGCGIPPDKQEIIFNRFEKVDSFKQGVGLGLPICSQIANRLGGSISLDIRYTDGARFIVRLPVTQ